MSFPAYGVHYFVEQYSHKAQVLCDQRYGSFRVSIIDTWGLFGHLTCEVCKRSLLMAEINCYRIAPVADKAIREARCAFEVPICEYCQRDTLKLVVHTNLCFRLVGRYLQGAKL